MEEENVSVSVKYQKIRQIEAKRKMSSHKMRAGGGSKKGTGKIHKDSREREREGEGWREKARGPVESVCFLINIRCRYCGFLTLSLFGLRINCRVTHCQSGLSFACSSSSTEHQGSSSRNSRIFLFYVFQCLFAMICHSFCLCVWVLPSFGFYLDSMWVVKHTLSTRR